MKRILFPSDFSPTAQNAFSYACNLAEMTGASIDLINVFHLPFPDSGSVPPDYITHLTKEKQTEVEEMLRAFAKAAKPSLVKEISAIYGIFIPQEVISLAQLNKYDLIVMGTKGVHDRMEKIMGSITTHTMMQAPCPVLAIPERAKFEPVKNIAYATDFSSNDQHSVKKLMEFTKALDAKVFFVHVETKPDIGDMDSIVEVESYPYEFSEFSVINSPSVMEGIDRYVDEKNIHWLTLFIPRRRLWERLFHVSFTKKMTFHTHKPILVFHE